MFTSFVLLLAMSGIKPVESSTFSRERQQAGIAATVRIKDVSRGTTGTGVVVGRAGPFVYVLTASHVVAKAERLEVATFSPASYPRPQAVYRNVKVIARSADVRDLAVLRFATEDTLPGVVRICPPNRLPRAGTLTVLTVGCDRGNAPTCLPDLKATRKRVRRPPEKGEAVFWEINGETERGRSGGPLLDKTGLLLGIASGNSSRKGYYCHVEEVHRFLREQGLKFLYEDPR